MAAVRIRRVVASLTTRCAVRMRNCCSSHRAWLDAKEHTFGAALFRSSGARLKVDCPCSARSGL